MLAWPAVALDPPEKCQAGKLNSADEDSPCQPILDDPARIVFKKDPRSDLFKVSARIVPVSPIDPEVEDISLRLANVTGTLFTDAFSAGTMVSNSRFNRWIFKVKKHGTEQVYKLVIREKLNKTTSELEYIVKWNAEADLADADPTERLVSSR